MQLEINGATSFSGKPDENGNGVKLKIEVRSMHQLSITTWNGEAPDRATVGRELAEFLREYIKSLPASEQERIYGLVRRPEPLQDDLPF